MKKNNNFFLCVIMLAISSPLFSQSKASFSNSNTISLGNNYLFYQDYNGKPVKYNYYLNAKHYVKNGKWAIGATFNTTYRTYSGNNADNLYEEIITRNMWTTELGAYYHFHYRKNSFCLGSLFSFRWRNDSHYIYQMDAVRSYYSHDIGIALPITYQFYPFKHFGIEAHFTPRFYHKINYSDKYMTAHPYYDTKYPAPHSFSTGIGFIYKIN